MIEIYKDKKEEAKAQKSIFGKYVKIISYIRFAVILLIFVLLYHNDKFNGLTLAALIIALLVLFGFLIKLFSKQKFNRDLHSTIASINEREINYLNNHVLDFENGQTYLNTTHEFSYDLDLFGKSSLFQHLNRTHTYIGHRSLSNSLISNSTHSEVLEKQKAILELEEKLEWRQNFLALAELQDDTENDYNFLLKWSSDYSAKISKVGNLVSYIMPVIFLIAFLGNIVLDLGLGNLVTLIFIINLSILGSHMKLINSEINKSTKLNKILFNFSLLINQIEKTEWKSTLLKSQSKNLTIDNTRKASIGVKELSTLFGNMDTIQNAVGAAIMNGSILYHIHLLRKLLKWKKQNGKYIKQWLDVIGQFESLICFANFKQNNPNYIFPKINENKIYNFKALGHPMIKNDSRICSDVDFTNNNFAVLTGSNMSGKSTFLRSLGINIILSKAGSVICAEEANMDLLDLRVSMRSTDSLSDNESYFFAEVKRLQTIMQHVQSHSCFILLDEILRGTNSDDKRNGTIKFLEKLIQFKAIGVIATHDLEVCNTTNNHPDYLTNKCFEVDIINDQLVFDYKLREGICQNQSATFLMKKNGII